MKIWNYHPATKELLGENQADPNPMEEGEFLVPAHATTTAPGEPQPGWAQVFNGAGWSAVTDHRGEIWWLADAKDNTRPFVIGAIGGPKMFDPPLTDVEPPAPPIVKVPVVASAAQIRMALTRIGLRSQIEAYVTSADQDTKDLWGFATEFPRDNGMIAAAAAALGQTPEQVDALFDLAKTL